MSRAHLSGLAVFLGAVVLAAAACTARVDDSPRRADVTVKQLTTANTRRYHGPVRAVLQAVRTHGNLTTAQQRRLDTIFAALEQNRADRCRLMKQFRTAAASVVRSGTADSAEFDRSVGRAVRAFEQRADQDVRALEAVHQMLDPGQRAAVAAALRARIDERFGARHRAHLRHRRLFKRVASYLMLSTSQIDQLRAAKKDLLGQKQHLFPSRAELLQLVNAFEGESFNAALEAFRVKKLGVLREHLARAGRRTDTVLALFTPEQRDLLADLILQGPRKVLLGEPDAASPRPESTTP